MCNTIFWFLLVSSELFLWRIHNAVQTNVYTIIFWENETGNELKQIIGVCIALYV